MVHLLEPFSAMLELLTYSFGSPNITEYDTSTQLATRAAGVIKFPQNKHPLCQLSSIGIVL